MNYSFVLEPSTYHAFDSEEAQIEACKDWNLLTKTASKAKVYMYKRNGNVYPVKIVGYVNSFTAVIELENGQLHSIHAAYLKEMQAASFEQKGTTLSEFEDSTVADSGADSDETASGQVVLPQSEVKAAAALASVVDISDLALSDSEEPVVKKEKKSAKVDKKPKLDLPEEKVKMTATVKEFATVPNHFSDNDDEVVIYEAVTITELGIEVGEAWSSLSATLKKLELEIGDKLSFEGKIVAKKLSKHPVAYKLNNPSKLVKVNEEA